MKNAPEVDAILKLLHRIVCGLVSHPSEVVIDPIGSGHAVLVDIYCHMDDGQKVIGRSGGTFQALSSLAEIASKRIKSVVRLRTVQRPEGGFTRTQRAEFKPNAKWPKIEVMQLLNDTLQIATGITPTLYCEEDGLARILTAVVERCPDSTIGDLRLCVSKLFAAIGGAMGVVILVDVRSDEPES